MKIDIKIGITPKLAAIHFDRWLSIKNRHTI